MKSKKILALVCAAAMTFGLAACGSGETTTETNETTEETASDSIIADSSEGASSDTSTMVEGNTEDSTENMM